MALVRWHRRFPMGPSFFEDEDWPQITWPERVAQGSGMNMYETDDEVVVEAQVPGIPEEDVQVTVEGNVLTISASHEETDEEKEKKKTVYKSTRQTSFNYSTSLPRMVKGESATAEVVDGVVTVKIPKSEEEKPKRIEITKKKK